MNTRNNKFDARQWGDEEGWVPPPSGSFPPDSNLCDTVRHELERASVRPSLKASPANRYRGDNRDNRDNQDNQDNQDNRGNREHRGNQHNGEFARRIWDSASDIKGTPAETYLLSRGVLPNFALTNLRFASLRSEGSYHPTLIARIDDAGGCFQAISRTFLKKDGSGKAPLDAPRKTLGPLSGGSVQLARSHKQLVLCEGLEDGLSVMKAMFKPVWVVLGAENLGKIEIPSSVKEIFIARDNDEVGIKAAQKAARHYQLRGFKVAIPQLPAQFKDFNEALLSPAYPGALEEGART